MIQGTRLASATEVAVGKVLHECSDDEIALDALAQWAMIPVGKQGGYGIEDNYQIIVLNLSKRFNASGSITSDYVARLRSYSTQFSLYGAEIEQVRARILETLRGDSGRKWREGLSNRLARSSVETRRFAYLLSYLMRRGYNPRNFEEAIDDLQAFHVAAFEKPFAVEALENELLEVGIISRFLAPVQENRQYESAINPILYTEHLQGNVEEFKIETDSKQLVRRLLDKKSFDLLRYLDEISSEPNGIKNFETSTDNLPGEKRVYGYYKTHAAISPFVLEEIRHDLRQAKRELINGYESRAESILAKLIDDNWPDAKVDCIRVKGEQALWRISNGANPNLYVSLATWATETQFNNILSALDSPDSCHIIMVVLNQSLESAKQRIGNNSAKCAELTVIIPGQKESKSDNLSGRPDQHSAKVIETLSRYMNLSTPIRAANDSSAPRELNLSSQFERPNQLKAFIGSKEGKEIYWAPSNLRNPNIAIFGDEDSGKTQLIKRILVEFRKSRMFFLVLDSSGQFPTEDQSNPVFGAEINDGEITINPLEPDRANTLSEQMVSVVETFRSIYGLKDEERDCLEHVLKTIYHKKGFNENDPSTWSNEPPILQEVHKELESIVQRNKGHEKNAAKELILKLSPVFGHLLFSQAKTTIPATKLVTGPAIVDLGSLKTDALKAITAEFLMAKLPSFLGSDTGEIGLYVVADGLHNLFTMNSPSLRLLREGRQLGLGIIYSCDDPMNLPELAFANTSALVTFRTSDSKNGKILVPYFGVKDDKALNKGLSTKFSAFVKFSREPSSIQFDASPYFKGMEQTAA